ncbi:MAG: RsmB/NOP family class I SAM-dependent RNA methyltransferase, partial [Burkholderiales bacterium]
MEEAARKITGGGDPRATATALLAAVLERRQPLDQALAGNRAVARLEPRDRAFVRLLVATVLRRLGQIDDALTRCLDRPLKETQPAVLNILRLGAAQLLFVGTPPHAAVATSVALAARGPAAGRRGLINAVLRRLAREGSAILAGQDAARLNMPDWLWQGWCATYGETETRAVAAAVTGDPPLDLSVASDPALWADRLGARLLPGGTLRLPAGSGDPSQLPGFREGAWWVQDAAAALPARLLHNALPEPRSGLRAIELCAAPGGKTAQLAAAGLSVTALERAPARLARLEENLARLALSADCRLGDALTWRPSAPVTAVLLDAPCSATGILRRHPDIAHIKSRTEVESAAREQKKLLAAAAEMVAPGGLLVYAVCSLEPEEGPQLIAECLSGSAA